MRYKFYPSIKYGIFLGVATAGGVVPAQSITAALRDLYSSMDKGNSIPPIILLQVLHMAFPRFAEKSEHGGFAQQVMIKTKKIQQISDLSYFNFILKHN